MVEQIINKIKKIKYIVWTDEKEEQLNLYFDFLIEENKIHNLTRITEKNEVWLKHFYDSLLICEEINFENKFVCDIGTGPGIPGIILKIFFPTINLTLIESNRKKTNFLEKVVKKLNFNNVKIITERAEEYSRNNIEQQDIIISRATAALNILLEIGVQSLKVGGLYIALKSIKLDDELKELNNSENKIGLEYQTTQFFEDEYLGTRKNIIYKKINKTNKKYPRDYKQIKNSPLGK